MIDVKKLDIKKLILFVFLLFVFVSTVIPSINYRPILSDKTCATIGATAPGSRNPCTSGEETLLKVVLNPTTSDFLLLFSVGLIINITASISLSLVIFLLHQRLYAKS